VLFLSEGGATRTPDWLVPRNFHNDGCYVVALGNVGEDEPRTWDALRRHAAGDDELLAEHASWALARLEEQGYVRQPHTSAGRVPTDMGYRAFVDQFLAERRAARPGPQIEARLRRAGTVADLLAHVSQEVSRASHHVGFAIAPAVETARLEHLEFVPLDGGKVLVVLVSEGGQVTQKVIEPSEVYRPVELQQAANYLNSEFKGRSLLEVRQSVLERLREERTLYDALMERALLLASSTFDGINAAPAVFIQGTSLLLDDMGAEDPESTPVTRLPPVAAPASPPG